MGKKVKVLLKTGENSTKFVAHLQVKKDDDFDVVISIVILDVFGQQKIVKLCFK